MALTAYSLIITIIVLRIYHQNPDKPLPKWFRTLVFDFMARIICYDTQSIRAQTVYPEVVKENGKSRLKDKSTGMSVILPEEAMVLITSLLGELNTKRKLQLTQTEWQVAAKVLDAFSLIMTVTIVVLVTGVMLIVIKY